MSPSPVPSYTEFARALVGESAEVDESTPLGALPAGDYALLARLDDAAGTPRAAAEADLVLGWHTLTLPEVYTLICTDTTGGRTT